MPLIPYKSFSIETLLLPEEVLARLAAAVEPVRWFRWWDAKCPFQGEVGVNGFRILPVLGYGNTFLRVSGYHNSWMPVIRGHLTPTVNGTRIEVTMALHPVVTVFTALWLGSVLMFGLVAIGAAVVRWVWNPMLVVPFVMFLFGWALMTGAFSLDAWRSLRRLREVVGAEADTPTTPTAS